MTSTNPFSGVRTHRRTLLKAAVAGLGASAVGGVTACSGDGSTGANSGPTIDPNDRVELPKPNPDVLYPDPYIGPKAYDRKPFGDGSKTFKVVVPTDPTVTGDWNKNRFSKWLEERTGVKIEYQAVNLTGPDGSQDLSKINAMLSSGELPDAFMSIGFSSGQVSLYGSQGVFQNLTGLLDAYAPMHRQMLSEIDTLKQTMTALDGNIYQFGSINDCYHCRSARSKAFIHQGYLDKIGAEMPQTTDDFRNVLLEFKERNPSGKRDFVPFLATHSEDPMDVWFVNPFTYNPGEPWLRVNAGKVEFVPTTEGWRQGMALMRGLFDDGTLTKQSFAITGAEMSKLGDRGLIGFARRFYWGGFLSIEYTEDALWYQYEPVMPLKGPSGSGLTSTMHYVTPYRSLVITSACEHPEQLVQWADYQMDLDGILNAQAGAQAKGWEYSAKGDKGLDGRQATWGRIPDAEAPVADTWNQLSLMYRSLDFRNAQYADPKEPNFEQRLLEVSQQYEEFAQPVEQELPPLIFDETSTATISDLATTINSHVTQSMAKFATAELEVNDDAAWNEYLNAFEKMGMSQYLELYQQAYDNRPK